VELAANPVPEGLAVPSISRRQEVHYSNGRSLPQVPIPRVSSRRIGRCDRCAKAGAVGRVGGATDVGWFAALETADDVTEASKAELDTVWNRQSTIHLTSEA
jgi:hypothetical protein